MPLEFQEGQPVIAALPFDKSGGRTWYLPLQAGVSHAPGRIGQDKNHGKSLLPSNDIFGSVLLRR